MLARADTPRGPVVLRRRTVGTDVVVELIANGAFVMDTVETSTERLLAHAALGRARRDGPLDVVVAGLGLGYTLHEVILDNRVGRVEVVELEAAVVDWVRAGLVPGTANVLTDRRVHPHVTDIRTWLPDHPARSVDVLLLDVDNGPDFLVHQENAQVYEDEFLSVVRRVLRPGGVVAVWTAERSDALCTRLQYTVGACEEIRRQIVREGRVLDYFLYVATVSDAS